MKYNEARYVKTWRAFVCPEKLIGTYDVKFDDQSGQLSIAKNGKVIAQAMARFEQRAKKANDFQLRSVTSGDETQLTGVTFGGSDKDIVITNSGASTTGSN